MSVNRGKDFEGVIKDAFKKVDGTFIVRLPDPTNGYLGIRNISDFLVYHYPHLYVIECKSVHGNTLPLKNITDNQWKGMSDAVKNNGVIAGVMCWWIDKDVTRFIPIQSLEYEKFIGSKSIRYDGNEYCHLDVTGKKKRVFFDYDMKRFFQEISETI